MKKYYFIPLFLLFITIENTFSQTKPSVSYITGKTPVGFESEINAFLRKDSASFPSSGTYLFTGSSTIRKWENLAQDFKEISIIQRGFGGSTMKALNYYIEYIVLPYKPETIVVYEGDNDLPAGVTTNEFLSQCDTFITKIHNELPHTMIYFISIKPSIARQQYLSAQIEINGKLKELLLKRPKTGFIDISHLMYDKEGKLRPDLFESDVLHINKEGYALWAAHIKSTMGINK